MYCLFLGGLGGGSIYYSVGMHTFFAAPEGDSEDAVSTSVYNMPSLDVLYGPSLVLMGNEYELTIDNSQLCMSGGGLLPGDWAIDWGYSIYNSGGSGGYSLPCVEPYSGGSSAQHSFDEIGPGTYSIYLTLTYGEVVYYSNCLTVIVGEHAAAGSPDEGKGSAMGSIDLERDDWCGQNPSDYSWTVDWGDCYTDTLDGNASYAWHIYNAPGVYTVTATSENINSYSSYGNNISITVEPYAYIQGPDTVVYHDPNYCNIINTCGANYNMDEYVLTLNDKNGDYWHVSWGDGQSEDIECASGGETTATHYYLTPGEFDIQAVEHYTDNNNAAQTEASNTQHVSVAPNMLTLDYGYGENIEGSTFKLSMILAYETQSDLTFNWHTYGQSAEAETDYIYGYDYNGTWQWVEGSYVLTEGVFYSYFAGQQDQDGDYSGTLTIHTGGYAADMTFTLPNTSDPIHMPKDFYIYFSTEDDVAVDYESAYVPIRDNNYGLILESIDAYAGDGSALIPIIRNYNGSSEIVNWSVSNGTADYGENADYWVEEGDGIVITQSSSSGASGYFYYQDGQTVQQLIVRLNPNSAAGLDFSYCASTSSYTGDPTVSVQQGQSIIYGMTRLFYYNPDNASSPPLLMYINYELHLNTPLEKYVLSVPFASSWDGKYTQNPKKSYFGFTDINNNYTSDFWGNNWMNQPDFDQKRYPICIARQCNGQVCDFILRAITVVHEAVHAAQIRGDIKTPNGTIVTTEKTAYEKEVEFVCGLYNMVRNRPETDTFASQIKARLEAIRSQYYISQKQDDYWEAISVSSTGPNQGMWVLDRIGFNRFSSLSNSGSDAGSGIEPPYPFIGFDPGSGNTQQCFWVKISDVYKELKAQGWVN
jgi:hypothetical protein